MPEAGRDEPITCMAKALITRPAQSFSVSAMSPDAAPAGFDSDSRSGAQSFSVSAMSPDAAPAGFDSDSRSGPCTNFHAAGWISSLPIASARIQSAPAGIFAMRSA